MRTIAEQIKGLRLRQRVTITGGFVHGSGGRVTLLERDRNGYAVFEPLSVREDVFIGLDRTDLAIER